MSNISQSTNVSPTKSMKLESMDQNTSINSETNTSTNEKIESME